MRAPRDRESLTSTNNDLSSRVVLVGNKKDQPASRRVTFWGRPTRIAFLESSARSCDYV